jgi:hypothetical protein
MCSKPFNVSEKEKETASQKLHLPQAEQRQRLGNRHTVRIVTYYNTMMVDAVRCPRCGGI